MHLHSAPAQTRPEPFQAPSPMCLVIVFPSTIWVWWRQSSEWTDGSTLLWWSRRQSPILHLGLSWSILPKWPGPFRYFQRGNNWRYYRASAPNCWDWTLKTISILHKPIATSFILDSCDASTALLTRVASMRVQSKSGRVSSVIRVGEEKEQTLPVSYSCKQIPIHDVSLNTV